MAKELVRLTPKQFQKWFESRKSWDDQDWKEHYESIGGNIPKKKN